MPLPKKIPRSRSAKESQKRVLANRYQVEKRLGSGNFGTAWLVKDLKTKDPKELEKVMKEISVGELQPDETVDANHEANLLRNLDHPGIVKYHNSFIDGEYFCIVTEYCDGGDLDARITQYRKEKKSFPEPLVVEWLIQLLLAVQYMHSRKVLHRDLKARNIFLRNNMIKVGDFGISRILMGTSDMASTFTGTPYYMSPEVLKHEGYNSKSDVWSVGCILYELVKLRHAFEGESLMGVMYKIVEGTLPGWPDSYSSELKEVCFQLLTKDPALRPSAAEALKLPFIEKQMEKLKNTMMDKHIAKEQKDSINRESKQIEMALNKKSRLSELKKQGEDIKWKNMSPRERMRLRKQMKADEEARKLQEAARAQLIDNTKKYQELRTNMNAYDTHAPPWLGGREEKENEGDEGPLVLGRPYTAPMKPPFGEVVHEIDESSEEESDEEFETVIEQKQQAQPEALLHPQHAQGIHGNPEERPITPMKDKMVYNLAESSLDFKDGIPDKPELAETYYSQFDDEFEGSGEEDEGSDGDSDEGTLIGTVGGPGDEEVGDLISCMQNALDRSDTIKSQTLTDNTVGAFGPVARSTKIKNLRAECEKKLGKEQFELAHEYLRTARFGDIKAGKTVDEAQIMKELKRIVKNPNDCFLVDQLLFLEEQAKMGQA